MYLDTKVPLVLEKDVTKILQKLIQRIREKRKNLFAVLEVEFTKSDLIFMIANVFKSQILFSGEDWDSIFCSYQYQ